MTKDIEARARETFPNIKSVLAAADMVRLNDLLDDYGMHMHVATPAKMKDHPMVRMVGARLPATYALGMDDPQEISIHHNDKCDDLEHGTKVQITFRWAENGARVVGVTPNRTTLDLLHMAGFSVPSHIAMSVTEGGETWFDTQEAATRFSAATRKKVHNKIGNTVNRIGHLVSLLDDMGETISALGHRTLTHIGGDRAPLVNPDWEMVADMIEGLRLETETELMGISADLRQVAGMATLFDKIMPGTPEADEFARWIAGKD